ncbi:hypothetical protein HAX54_028247 [Datura stramonium]|uniref:Uncharacterized protein n=1 Tax=Datura stramonium TaxID=4076 RepID=A0ABS8V3T9_DATST|nr:hypothetical protein [Datura stramonium]
MNNRMEDKRLLAPLEERVSVQTLEAVLINYDGDDIQGYTEMFDEGSDKAKSDGDNPPADNVEESNGNAEEGNDDAEESGDDDTEAEESGDKESAAEKSNEQVGDSEPATTPEARSKRWFL